jgi:glycosyltransferase involved in cell wall biosynthesis
MIGDKTISLIIPCKNEENILPDVLQKIPEYIDEILVIDNGSKDNSIEVARSCGAKVFSEPRKLNGIGYGYAHIRGLKEASGDYIFAMDADDTYPVLSIRPIVEYMEKYNIDVVSCSRLPLKNKKAISKIRRLGIYILNLEIFFLYGKFIRDILTGMWGIRKDSVERLSLKMGDWNLSPEIKISAFMHKDIRFREYSIQHFIREQEPSKQAIWYTGLNHLLYILKRRFTTDSVLGGLLYKKVVDSSWPYPRKSDRKKRFLI